MVERRQLEPQEPLAVAATLSEVAATWLATSASVWSYEQGLVAKALWASWSTTRDLRWKQAVEAWVAGLVKPDGRIRGYRPEEFNIDNVNPGKVLFALLDGPDGQARWSALQLVRSQLHTHPRTKTGGFWHKAIYPHQMWLDGLYMASPFLAEFAARFGPQSDFDDVVHQFTLMESQARNPRTGLLYHGWDESRGMKWSHDETGCSPCYWGRSVGWFAMALVDTLEWMPPRHPGQVILTDMTARLFSAMAAYQDRETGLWWQVLDKPGDEGNYLETSVSAMMAYAQAKAVRLGLGSGGIEVGARRAWGGLVQEKLSRGTLGWELKDICSVAGLGGNPYRNGSYGYYVGEPRVANDPKALGPMILAGLELDDLSPGSRSRDEAR